MTATTLLLFLILPAVREDVPVDLNPRHVAGQGLTRHEVYEVDVSADFVGVSRRKYRVTNTLREEVLAVEPDRIRYLITVIDSRISGGHEVATQYNLYELRGLPLEVTFYPGQKRLEIKSRTQVPENAVDKLESFRRRMLQFFSCMPEKAEARTGERWTVHDTFNLKTREGETDSDAVTTYTFDGLRDVDGKTYLQISGLGRMSTSFIAAEGVLTTDLEETLLLDPETRQMALFRSVSHQTGDIESPEGSSLVDARVKVSISFTPDGVVR